MFGFGRYLRCNICRLSSMDEATLAHPFLILELGSQALNESCDGYKVEVIQHMGVEMNWK